MTSISSKKSSQTTSFLVFGIAFLIITFNWGNVYSQRITLDGKINTIDDIEVEGINIYNLSTEKGTITDAKGEFKIAVSLNDSLSISALQIQNTILVIGEEQMVDKKITINLSERMNELGTVTLRRSLSGYLGTDANIIHTDQPITATSTGLPNADLKKLSKTRRELYTATSASVDALLNLISGRTKMLKKRIEFEKTYELTLSLLDKFPETYFTDALQIEKHKVYSFIFYCEDDPNYQNVMNQNTMAIMEFLKRKSVEYRAERG